MRTNPLREHLLADYVAAWVAAWGRLMDASEACRDALRAGAAPLTGALEAAAAELWAVERSWDPLVRGAPDVGGLLRLDERSDGLRRAAHQAALMRDPDYLDGMPLDLEASMRRSSAAALLEAAVALSDRYAPR